MAEGIAEAVFHDIHLKVQTASGPLVCTLIWAFPGGILQTLSGELATRDRSHLPEVALSDGRPFGVVI